jgi:hypothetical protein
MAARGEIPGAAKFGSYTFDVGKLRQFVKDKEEQLWQRKNQKLQPDAIGGAIPFGAARRSKVRTSAGRYTQITQRLRKSGVPQDETGR